MALPSSSKSSRKKNVCGISYTFCAGGLASALTSTRDAMRPSIEFASSGAALRRAYSQRGHSASDGFTLIEVLAALAISSVIIVGTTALIHAIAGNFDRG